MKIISFSGKLQSGKTTTALMLEQLLVNSGYRVGRISFAKALKDELWRNFLQQYDIPRAHLDDPKYKEQYRTVLTWFGTDFIRKLNPNHWCDKVEQQLNQFAVSNKYDFVIGDDTRFQNEFKMLRGKGALMIRMTRENATLSSDHPSETDLDEAGFDLWVTNSGTTLEELENVVSSSLLPRVGNYFGLLFNNKATIINRDLGDET